MTRWASFVAATFVPAALALAQGGEADQADAARLQRELQQNRIEVERLVDLRLRHDLGLLVKADEAEFRSPGPVTTEVMEQLDKEKRDQEARIGTLLEQYNKLRTAVDQLRADAAAQPQKDARSREFVDVPAAGAAQPLAVPSTSGARGNPEARRPDAAPSARVEPGPPAPALQRDPLRGHIHGSSDHQRVARAMFKAGQALMDRAAIAREQQNAPLAKELDAEAKERLQLALEELAPLLKAKEPVFEALFYQGRCRELLFRFSEHYEGLSLASSTRDYQRREQEVREPFLCIAARDVKKSGARQEIEVLGAWGMAAQTAMEHFRWMNLHGGYSPRAAIEALTWPGERDL